MKTEFCGVMNKISQNKHKIECIQLEKYVEYNMIHIMIKCLIPLTQIANLMFATSAPVKYVNLDLGTDHSNQKKHLALIRC